MVTLSDVHAAAQFGSHPGLIVVCAIPALVVVYLRRFKASDDAERIGEETILSKLGADKRSQARPDGVPVIIPQVESSAECRFVTEDAVGTLLAIGLCDSDRASVLERSDGRCRIGARSLAVNG